jgi:hypothetical protein
MSRAILDADDIVTHATPLVHQQAHETHPFGHLVRMPIALPESTCTESIGNFNQLLADTMTPVQISRLLHAHEIVLKKARTMARLAAAHDDQGTNDLLVGDVIRTNELQVWFVSEHVVDTPVVRAD